ncbi:MAG TPA: hypothetical protein VN043_04335 [Rhodanobacter sp.]|nr:hypothetical protein [Rhodanobacter sp.]
MRSRPASSIHQQRLFTGAALWLLAGGFALLTTLLPAHTELLGWTPLFWLLGAPLSVLLALEPGLVRLLLTQRRARHLSTIHGVPWH